MTIVCVGTYDVCRLPHTGGAVTGSDRTYCSIHYAELMQNQCLLCTKLSHSRKFSKEPSAPSDVFK